MGHVARRIRALLGGVSLPLLLVVGPRGALGAASAEAAPGYDAAPECPVRQDWVEQLYARLPASPAARAAADALHVRIERSPIGASGSEYRGVVVADSAEEVRAVSGTSCREVFEALLLIAALSLDAARGEPAGSDGPGSSPTRDVPPAKPMDTADRATPAEGTGVDRVRWGAAGLVLVQSGIAPNPSLDVGAGLVARWSRPGFEPWFLLGVYTGVASQTVRVAGASARFEHAALRAVGCPWRYPSTGWLALRPCLGLDVGRCRGEGSGVSGALSNSTLWLAARGELRFEFSLYDGLTLGAAGGAALPFVRARFYFEPGAVAFQAPAFGLEASGFATWLF